MQCRTYDRLVLIGGQFAFLVAGLISCIAESVGRHHAPLCDFVLACIAGHTSLLVILARRLVTERRERDAHATALSDQLGQALRKAEDLTECCSDLVWETDERGRFSFVSDHNRVMGEDWGLHVGMLVTDLADLDPVTPRDIWLKQMASNRRGEPFRDFQYSLRRADGKIAYFCVNGIPIRSEAGDLIGFRGTTRDRTAEIESLQTLSHEALHDPLTGLPNRRFLMKKLDDPTLSPTSRTAILQLDLDGFKTINDLHGHAVGDQLLRLVAGRLCEVIRTSDVACRIGGDEFVIVMSGAGKDDAVHFAQCLINALTSSFVIEGLPMRVGVSIGIALSPDHGPASSLLLRLGDQALYEIKRMGGNGLRIYQDAPGFGGAGAIEEAPAHDTTVQELRDLATLPGELDGALRRDELSLAFQPIRLCADGSIAAVEALLRWNSPKRGAVPPDVFVPVAEETGLIVPIGAWVLRQACRFAVAAGGSWRIAVNLSPVQFQQPDLAFTIGSILRESGLPPERLILELTEQILVSKFPTANATLRKLRAMGIALALDDFGAGFSNVSYLRDFRFDLLKIDRAVMRIAH